MSKSFAELIINGRGVLGVDQAEFGRRVGVGQQTVSRWERGQGRPRRSVAATVAQVLSVDVDAVLTAAGYAGPTADSAAEAAHAVRPLIRGVPLHELAPDRFEDLSTEIAQQLHPDGHASRFGGSGEKQRGIDIFIDGARQITVQCKRHRQFGPQDVRQAVADTEFEAPKNYLFLSRQTATVAARSEMAKYPRWELWDGEDIARFIRTGMTRDAAVRLVDTYFPNYREPFLGVPRPGPFLLPRDFFASATGDQIFTHDWTLSGRTSELTDLSEAVRSGMHGIARLVGRGGLGKTRLLRAIAESFEAEHWTVRFLPHGAKAHPQDFELLPASGPSLLIIDDAHDRSDIAEIHAHLRGRNPEAKLLIAMRPYGEVGLSQDVRRAGILLSELSTTTLSDLTQYEAEILAREALGGAHDALIQRLAHVTVDCPLATVVAGVLIRRGRLSPSRLEQDEGIRTEILSGFRDAIVADSLEGDSELRRSVLDGLSALQPFRSADPAFQDTMSTIVKAPYDRVQHHLRSLEDAGVLLRRGDALRLVPDLLGDVVLAQACFDERSGVATGFLARLVDAAKGDALAHVFVNASRVDWQVRQQRTEAAPMASSLWDALEGELAETDVHGRRAVLQLLKRVAYFQPERTLKVINWIVSHPTNELLTRDDLLARLYPPTWDDVLYEIPPVLQRVAYNLDSLDEACEILWHLAQLDRRPTNQHPEHPLRVLRDLAEFSVSKPITYNRAILDIASRWLASAQQLSPFEVLEPLLATEGSAQSYRDNTITFRPFALNLQAVLPLRQRVVDLALGQIRSSDLRRAASGVRAIERALRFPSGSFGRQVSSEERAAWEPDFVRTIEELGRIVAEPELEPAIAVAVMKALHWHAEYAKGATHEAAAAVQALMPDATIFQLALLLHDGWGHLVRRPGVPFQESHELLEEHLTAVAAQVAAEYDDADAALLLERRLQVEREAFDQDAGNPNPMIGAIIDARPEIALSIIERVIADPQSSLVPMLPVVLGRFGERSPKQLVSSANRLLALQVSEIDAFVSRSFGWNRGLRSSLVDGELQLLKTFATSADPSIRQSAIIAAQRVAEEHPQIGVDLIASVSFRDAPWLGDEIFRPLADDEGPLRWDLLSDSQQAAIREELVEVMEVDGYSLMTFLALRSATDPYAVIDLFRSRIVKGESLERLGAYQPTPFDWDVPLRIREHEDFIPVLRDLLDWVGASDSWVRREMGASLFRDAAGALDDSVLALLREGLAGPSQASVDAVAAVLRKAPSAVVYKEVPFILEALDAAGRFGEECEQTMRGALWTAMISGSRMGTPGEPFPEDIRQRDECGEIAKTLPTGSRGQKFYMALSESAEKEIQQEIERDRRDDRRDW